MTDNKIEYIKPFLSDEKLVEKLRCLGVIVSNDESAIRILSNVCWSKLGLYIYPFRKTNNGKVLKKVVSDTKIEQIIELYNFDKRLRLVLLDGLENIETSLKAKMVSCIGAERPFYLYDSNVINSMDIDNGGYNKIEKHLIKNSYTNKKLSDYTRIPIWIAIEVFMFGDLVHLFNKLPFNDKKSIARNMNFTKKQITCFYNSLKQLNGLRNLCAHHSLVWNASYNNFDLSYSTSSGVLKNMYNELDDMSPVLAVPNVLYARILIIWHILSAINPTSEWNIHLQSVMDTFPKNLPNGLSISKMGFPENWEKNNTWKL